MKIATELIRMLIFYEDYDTNKDAYANTLYCSSETNGKIIGIIITNIKKCINMLKKIDVSIWVSIIKNLNENIKSISDKYSMTNLEEFNL